MRGVAVIIIILLVLSVLAFSALRQRGHAGTSTSSSTTIGGATTIPQGILNQAWLNQSLIAWKPTSTYPMNFSAQMTLASYDNIGGAGVDTQALLSELSMLNSTGAKVIRIDIGYDSWLKNNTAAISELNSTVRMIRADGDKLCIADASAEAYRKHQLPWEQFKAAWVARVTALASLYHPYCYVVVKEPGWYVPMVSDARTSSQFQNASDWVNLTQQLTTAVHNVSPSTLVGVSIDAGGSLSNQPAFYTQFLNGVKQLPGVSFIGFDIYTESAFNNTMAYLNAYGSGGKQVWIAETWANPALSGSACSAQDSQFMYLAYYFAQKIHAQLVSPFFTDCFVSFNNPPTTSAALVSYYQGREPSYYAYSNITAANRAG